MPYYKFWLLSLLLFSSIVFSSVSSRHINSDELDDAEDSYGDPDVQDNWVDGDPTAEDSLRSDVGENNSNDVDSLRSSRFAVSEIIYNSSLFKMKL